MGRTLVVALLGLLALSACGQRASPPPPSGEPKVNANSTVTESSTERPTGEANTRDTQTQLNSGRPDKARDLQPGTDGNTNPPPR